MRHLHRRNRRPHWGCLPGSNLELVAGERSLWRSFTEESSPKNLHWKIFSIFGNLAQRVWMLQRRFRSTLATIIILLEAAWTFESGLAIIMAFVYLGISLIWNFLYFFPNRFLLRKPFRELHDESNANFKLPDWLNCDTTRLTTMVSDFWFVLVRLCQFVGLFFCRSVYRMLFQINETSALWVVS